MDTALFFQTLSTLYPKDTDLCLEIRPLLPEWRKEGLTDEEIRAAHTSVRRWYALDAKYLANAATYAESYKDAFDVYYGVLPRSGRGGGQSDVWGASCLFCDVDGGDDGIPGAIALVKGSGLPLPHLAVVSGGGTHCYWLLSEVVIFESHAERETYKAVLRRLGRVIGGESPGAHFDFSACECARILRVPNTLNWKRENEPRTVKTVRSPRINKQTDSTAWGSTLSPFNPNPLSYEDWRGLLPREPVEKLKEQRTYSSYDALGTVSEGLKNWARQGYPQGKRHQDLSGAAAWLVRDCKLHAGDALSLLRQKAQHSPGVRTITDRELENMIRWASR